MLLSESKINFTHSYLNRTNLINAIWVNCTKNGSIPSKTPTGKSNLNPVKQRHNRPWSCKQASVN